MKSVISRIAAVASGSVLLLGLAVGSASAVTLPFYLSVVPPDNGVNVGTVVPPVGSTQYGLWADPSAITGGLFGLDANISSHGTLTMTAFAANAANGTTANLCLTATGCGTVSFQELSVISGATAGNTAPFEIGVLTIANAGGPAGDVTLFTGDYTGSDFALHPATAPQVLAAVIPEPGTLVLLGFGMGGLAVLIRRARS